MHQCYFLSLWVKMFSYFFENACSTVLFGVLVHFLNLIILYILMNAYYLDF